MAIVFNLDSEVRYFCFCGGVDMRKGIRSLYGMVKSAEGCESSALSGDAFVFIGTTRKSVKILRWQREGFILYHKRLEVGTFNLPRLSSVMRVYLPMQKYSTLCFARCVFQSI
ncbi:MAG: IS66 family insertion sequence element accessory protein TnpB [Rikenellaceae bacterium]